MFLASTNFLNVSNENWQMLGAVVAVVLAISAVIGFIIKIIYSVSTFIQRFKTVEANTSIIADELKQLRTDLSVRIDNLADLSIQNRLSEAHSPRQLNDAGKKVLNDSGINTVVDDKFEYIVNKVKSKNPENAYQAEQAILDAVEHLIDDPAIKDAVENGAFQSGQPIAAVLYVGGLYIRDRVLETIGFEIKDIDTHNPGI
jgi:hypothetical protein